MLNKQEIFKTIQDNKEIIKSFGVIQIGLFGSYVRGEQTLTSNIDFLVDYKKGEMDFFKFIDFCETIENLFANLKVDVVTKNGLSEFIGPYILKEVEYVKI